MCGIFATTAAARWRPRLDEVLSLLGHRGPDAVGAWADDDADVLLAHTRLEIIGLGQPGAQPLSSADGSVTATYNGELYNYRAVARELGLDAAESDTAVLVELLARRGPAGLAAVRGMYAFAAWDRRNRQLLVGRDRYGIKPLYVLHHLDGNVTVASELPALLLDPEARTIDPLGVGQYLAFGHTGPLLTSYERVRKLAPQTVASWQLSGQRPLPRSTAVRRAPEGSAEDLGSIVDDTVAAHLVADVEVGVFLSGGVDSTLVAASAAARVDGLRTYTITFPDRPAVDEAPLAAHNARLLGTRHVETEVRDADMAAAAVELARLHGEPFGDAAALALMVLARRASQDVKVVLTGEGADEVFGGYRRYDVSRRVGSIPFGLPPLARRVAAARGDRPRDRAVEAALWGGGVRSHGALLGGDLNDLSVHTSVFADVGRMARTDWASVASGDERETARRFDLVRWLPNVYLEKVDRATMASSLEARVPYLDGRVEDHAASMPFGKLPLRRELETRLPGVALPDRKKGLAIHLPTLLREPALAEPLRSQLEGSHSTVRELFGDDVLARVRARCDRSATTAFRVAMLGLWRDAVT